MKPPPSYPPIKGEKAGSDHNLDTFISMDKSEGQGDVLRLMMKNIFKKHVSLSPKIFQSNRVCEEVSFKYVKQF